MGQTFGDRFRNYGYDVQSRLWKRFKAAAVVVCNRYRVNAQEAEDMVQHAFAALFSKQYDIDPTHNFESDPEGGMIALVWKIMENKLLCDLRKNRRSSSTGGDSELDQHATKSNDQISAVGKSFRRPYAESSMIANEEYLLFIRRTERLVAELESVLGTRRRDFRDRARKLFETFCSNPEKYVQTAGSDVRIHAKELAKDVGMEENAYQQFKSRVDTVLEDAGLSLDRILLGILVHYEAAQLGNVPQALRIEF
jgi:DNA-directed RNA polymerase specialized sigma24 family protein